MANGWVLAKVCAAQESLSQASTQLIAARLDLARLSEDFDGSATRKMIDEQVERIMELEQALDGTLTRAGNWLDAHGEKGTDA